MFLKFLLLTTAIFSNLTHLDWADFQVKLRENFIKQTEIQTLDIPFTSQAPFAEWHDPRQQDGCEEASILMVAYWIQNKKLTAVFAQKELLNLADFQERNFGNAVDTSLQDTADRLLKKYFQYSNFSVKKIISPEDLIFELALGHAIVVPTDGQLLQNPYFTAPGPERHMLVIKGYDKTTQEFITNDPGTRHGENFRYKQAIFLNAIRDYPTGEHLPIKKTEKTILVIRKKTKKILLNSQKLSVP